MLRFVLIASLFAVIVFQMVGEKVPVNDGAMGDGLFYRSIAADFLGKIENESYNVFQLQRVMPFAVLNVTYSVFEWVKSHEGLLRGIVIFNFLMLALGVYWYFALAKKLHLRDNMTVLGFLLLFVNFAVLKDMWYNPFHPGFTAMMLGIGQVNYFVRVERQRLFLLSLVAGFVWPSMFLTGLFLMFMPSEKLLVHEKGRPKSLYPFLVCGGILLVILISGFFVGRLADLGLDLFLYILSILALLIYFFAFLIKNPIQWLNSLRLLTNKTKGGKLQIFWMSIAAFFLIIFLLSGSNANIYFLAVAENYFKEILRFPLDFLVGHTLYFGFLVPLAMVFFPRMMKEMANLGMGFSMACTFMFIFILHPEPQFLMPFFPLLGLLVLKAVKRYRILTKDLLVIGGANILLSATWLPLNVHGMAEALQGADVGLLSKFPAQRYWMHFGHMMSWEVYIGAAVLFAVLVFLAWNGKIRYRREERLREG